MDEKSRSFSFKKIKNGDIKEAARLITAVENNDLHISDFKRLLQVKKKAYIIGITGPPGVGKSSFINQLILSIRKIKKSVGVIAIDPSSPFSGGAVLGDRIRMQLHNQDKDVFIRSMASRNITGGVNIACSQVINVMDLMGKDFIILETVGSGQDEVSIYKLGYTIIVILSPDYGDDLQLIKSGIMEIGDIYILNKGDNDQADKYFSTLRDILSSRKRANGWELSILKANSLTGHGIKDILDSVIDHRNFISKDNCLDQKIIRRLQWTVSAILKQRISNYIDNSIINNLANRKEILDDPFRLADDIIYKIKSIINR